MPTVAMPTMAMPTMAIPTTHVKQALLKATLKVSKTESYTIELDATKARYTLLCYYVTMLPCHQGAPHLPCYHVTMLPCYYVTMLTSSLLTAPRRRQGETHSSKRSTNGSLTSSCAGEW